MQGEFEGVDQGRAAQGEERHDPKQRGLEGEEQVVEFAGVCEGTFRKIRQEKSWASA